MVSEARRRANDKWSKENEKKYVFRLYKKSDADLIEFYENAENKQGLIRRLLRQEMEKGE